MVEQVRISDFDSAKEWLNAQEYQTQVWFATRSALRALPAVGAHTDMHPRWLPFAIFRATLIAAAASSCQTREMPQLEKAVLAAADTGALTHSLTAGDSEGFDYPKPLAAARSAVAALHTFSRGGYKNPVGDAASAAAYADEAAENTSQSVGFYACTLDANAPTNWQRLWPDDTEPENLKQNWNTLKAKLVADGQHWNFWIEWYEAVRDGTWTDWDLILRIATEVSEEDDWEAGPVRIAERIKEVETNLLAERTRLQETIELNPETALFRAIPVEVINSGFIAALLSRVEDCLEDAISGNNGLTPTSREVKTLKRTIGKYAKDPQRIELDLTSVSVSFRRQIYETGELAASEDNLALLEASEEGARGLRANHPEIAENRNRLAHQAMSEMQTKDLELLEEAKPLLVAISEGQMAEDFERDIPQLINDAITPLPSGAPPLPGADEATRIFYRTSMMAKLYKLPSTAVQGYSKATKSRQFNWSACAATWPLHCLRSLNWV